MNSTVESDYLKETLELLVRHFGKAAVSSAVAKIVSDLDNQPSTRSKQSSLKKSSHSTAFSSAKKAINALQEDDPEKYQLLHSFFERLRSSMILPEANDVRYFAFEAGIKDPVGKSRKELISKMMPKLISMSTEHLRRMLPKAEFMSEKHRREGFSILTEALLGKPSTKANVE